MRSMKWTWALTAWSFFKAFPQRRGRDTWYSAFPARICQVEHDYEMPGK
jgi:hypothetical protein